MVKKFYVTGTESSLPCSQKLVTLPYTEPVDSPHLHALFLHFNIILSSMTMTEQVGEAQRYRLVLRRYPVRIWAGLLANLAKVSIITRRNLGQCLQGLTDLQLPNPYIIIHGHLILYNLCR